MLKKKIYEKQGPFLFAILCGLASISWAEPTNYEAAAKYEMPAPTAAPYADKKEEYATKPEPKKEEYPMRKEYKKMEQPTQKYKRSIEDAEESGDGALKWRRAPGDALTESDPIWGFRYRPYPYFGYGYRPFGYGRYWDNDDQSTTNDVDDVDDAEEQAEPIKLCVGKFCVGSKRRDYARDPFRACYRSKSGRQICVGSDGQEMDPLRACYTSKSGRRICVANDEMDPIRVCYTSRSGRRICVGNDGQEMDPRGRCWRTARGQLRCRGGQAMDPLCIKGPFGLKLCT